MLVCVLLALPLGALTSCSKNDKKDGLISGQVQVPQHFRYIPADSPYVIADLVPIPYEQLGWNLLESYGPLVATARAQMAQQLADQPAEYTDPGERAVLAVLDELDGKMSVAGMRELGLSTQGHMALYGVGVWPVLRVELADTAKFEAMIKRVEGRAGQPMPTATVHGVTFRQVGDDTLKLPLIIHDNELVMGITSTSFYDQYIANALKKDAPERSLYDENRLQALQAKHQLKPYVSGYVDIAHLTRVALGQEPQSLTARSLQGQQGFPLRVGPECQSEYLALASQLPRLFFGYYDVTRQGVRAVMGLEATHTFARTLAGTREPIPGYGDSAMDDAMMSIGLGLSLDKLLGALQDESNRLTQAPYRCPDLQELNQMAQSSTYAAQQIPPFLRGIKGVSLIIKALDMDFTTSQLNKVEAALLIKTADPQGLYAAISSFLPPQLQGINIKPDGQPVALPADELQAALPNLPTPYLIMTQDGLALSLGAIITDQASAMLKANPGATPMASYGLDMSRFVKLLDALNTSGSSESEELMRSLKMVYESIGAMRMSFDVDAAGYYVRTEVVMNPQSQPKR